MGDAGSSGELPKKYDLEDFLYYGTKTPEERDARTKSLIKKVQTIFAQTDREYQYAVQIGHLEIAALKSLGHALIPGDYYSQRPVSCRNLTSIQTFDDARACVLAGDATEETSAHERDAAFAVIALASLLGAVLALATSSKRTLRLRRGKSILTTLKAGIIFWVCLFIDLLSYLSYKAFAVHHIIDLAWAPAAAVLILVLFQDKRAALLMLIKELLPIVDSVPMALMIWFAKYVFVPAQE